MKRQFIPIFSIITILTVFSCQKASSLWQTGDLIFVEGMSSGTMDKAIMESTGTIVHVGMVDVVDGEVFVIDAAPATGVSRRSLEDFIEAQRDANGTLPTMRWMRLRKAVGTNSFIAKARGLCGLPYDYSFLPDNGRYYCSELVYECYVAQGKPLFEAAPMNFQNADGSYDPYWVDLFERQGMDVPQGLMGTNPESMSKSKCLKAVKTLKGAFISPP